MFHTFYVPKNLCKKIVFYYEAFFSGVLLVSPTYDEIATIPSTIWKRRITYSSVIRNSERYFAKMIIPKVLIVIPHQVSCYGIDVPNLFQPPV
nr:hypothetical protein SPCC297.02 - fission yeast (Schizosaccharomyces pombe) [Schizosaccharomyces pombe]